MKSQILFLLLMSLKVNMKLSLTKLNNQTYIRYKFYEKFPEDQKSLFKKALGNMESSLMSDGGKACITFKNVEFLQGPPPEDTIVIIHEANGIQWYNGIQDSGKYIYATYVQSDVENILHFLGFSFSKYDQKRMSKEMELSSHDIVVITRAFKCPIPSLAMLDYINQECATGASGLKGNVGENGRPGFNGWKGDKGAKGTMGVPGYPGMKGEQGKPGFYGPPGFPGTDGSIVKGEKGEKGPPCLPSSVKSDDDFKCLKGDKGWLGLPGMPGVSGLAGIKGIQGLPGRPGYDGLPGRRGIKGDPADCRSC